MTDDQQSNSQRSPEPPNRYNSTIHSSQQPQQPQPMNSPSHDNEGAEFDLARKLIIAAQIMAAVSLLIGGIILDVVAIIVAIIGYRRSANGLESAREAHRTALWSRLRRSGIIAICMCAGALALNAIALAMVYPMVMQALQTGDTSILGISESGTWGDPITGNSTWG